MSYLSQQLLSMNEDLFPIERAAEDYVEAQMEALEELGEPVIKESECLI